MTASDHTARLLRKRRQAHALSRAQLALRAGVEEARLSAQEDGRVTLAADELRRYLRAMGEELSTDEHVALPIPHRYDEAQIAAQVSLPMGERLARALAWDDFAANLRRARRVA